MFEQFETPMITYQRKNPENFQFSEQKILFFKEPTLLVKNSKNQILIISKYNKNKSVFKPISMINRYL